MESRPAKSKISTKETHMMTVDYYFKWPRPNSIIQLKQAPEMEQESGTGTRLTSVEVTLTIMKTEDTHTGVVIESVLG